MMRFQNKIALITGASKGIGAAIAVRLASEGATVVITYRADKEGAEMCCTRLRKAGAKAESIACDITSSENIERIREHIATRYGLLDILVNNAGVLVPGTVEKFEIEDWDETFLANTRGPVLCARHFAPLLEKSKSGNIVNIASRLAIVGAPNSVAYGASKAALVNITKSLARHFAPRIRVNAVAPGYTETELTAGEPQEWIDAFVAQTPLGRTGMPEDTAAAVAFLASSDASFITGHTLIVDGGYVIR